MENIFSEHQSNATDGGKKHFIGIKTADAQFLNTRAHSQMALCSFTNNHSPFILTSHILVLYTDDHRGFVLNAVINTKISIIYRVLFLTVPTQKFLSVSR